MEGCRFTGSFNRAVYAYWYNYGLIIRNNNFLSSGPCIYLYNYNNNAIIKNNNFSSPSNAIYLYYYNYNYDISENTLNGGDWQNYAYGIYSYRSYGSITSNEVSNYYMAIYDYQRYGNMTIRNNTIVKNYNGIYGYTATSYTTTINNNIISSAPEVGGTPIAGSYGIYDYYTYDFVSNYNDLYNNTTNYFVVSQGAGDILTNASFKDPNNNDYHLNPDSPCINAGTPAGTDIGRYQYLLSVNLISPNGGETWEAGSKHLIRWTTEGDPTEVRLYYTSGEAYQTIATGLSDTGSYLWTLPDVNTTEAIVRIEAENTANAVVTAESDGPFEIVATYDYPSVEVFTPNSGSKIGGSMSFNITWLATDEGGIAEIQLYYTTGEGWQTIATGEQNDGAYSWTAPLIDTNEAIVSVLAIDDSTAHNVGSAESAYFIVDSTPPTVPNPVTPANGSTITEGKPTFTWEAASDNLSGIVSYEINVAGVSRVLGAVLAYTPTGNLPDGTITWEVRAKDGAGNWGSWSSLFSFTHNDLDSPLVTVEAPNGGEKWGGGQTHNITWQATDESGISQVKLYYGTGEGWVAIVSGLSNTGSYSWLLPAYNTNEALVSVEAIDNSGALNIGYDASAAPFIIDSEPPSVPVLLSPADGAIVALPPTISWQESTDNLSGVANYELTFDATLVVTFGAATLSTPTSGVGAHSWKIRAKDQAANWSAYSPLWTYTVTTDVYVDAVNGNDGNTGTSESQAWQTLTYATGQVGGGQRILVKEGVYDNAVLGEFFPIYLPDEVAMVGFGAGIKTIESSSGNDVLSLYYASTVEGFTIRNLAGTGYIVYYSDNYGYVNQCSLEVTNGAGGFLVDGGYGSFLNSSFTGNGGGNQINGSNFTINNGTLTGSLLGRLMYFNVLTTGHIIRNSYFSEANGNQVLYFRRGNSNTIIENNVIAGPGGSQAVYFDSGASSDNVLIRNNLITGLDYNNGTGISLYGNGTIVSNEVRSFNTAIEGQWDSSGTLTVEGNTIVGFQGGVSNNSDTLTIIAKNNIIAAAPNLGGGVASSYGLYNGGAGSVVSDYNCPFNNMQHFSGVSAGVSDIITNPRFVNPTGNDFRLYANSPCVGAGEFGVNMGRYNAIGASLTLPSQSYVSALTGDDTLGDGTIGNPWKTITRASASTEGTIHVLAGTYDGLLGESFPIYLGDDRQLLASAGSPIIDGTGSGVNIIYAGLNSVVSGLDIQQDSGFQYALAIHNNKALVSQCTLEISNNAYGLQVVGNNVRVAQNTFIGSLARSGLEYQGSAGTIEGNTFTGSYDSGFGGQAVNMRIGSFNRITNNQISNSAADRDGINVSGANTYLTIEANTIQAAGGGNGVYVSSSINNFYIHDNTIIGGDTSGAGMGLYLVGYGSVVSNEVRSFGSGIYVAEMNNGDMTFNNNTIVKCLVGWRNEASAAYSATVTNTILACSPETGGVGLAGSYGMLDAGNGSTSISRYNSFYGNETNTNLLITDKTGDVYEDPEFVNVSTDNYRLGGNSICVDAGTPEGNDMGRYQFGVGYVQIFVTAPATGDVWSIGSSRQIIWETSGRPTAIDLYYTTGEVWLPIALGQPNSKVYSWPIPNNPSTEAKVLIQGAKIGSIGTGESGFFTITPDQIAPSVEVTNPTFGNIWRGNATYEVTWTATDESGIDSVSLYYRLSSAESWTAIATGQPNSGNYFWLVPAANTVEAAIKVEAIDSSANHNIGTGESDVFTVDSLGPDAPTLEAPANGSTTTESRPMFSWLQPADNFSGVASYEIAIDNDTFLAMS
ncbi:MAG: right-handed parallel beta-helix repeat-containing protein [Candidatus Margulisiibacteriota bacterium]